MKRKVSVNITLDIEVYNYFRTYEDINISAHVNEMLKFQMHSDEDNREQNQLEKELDELKKNREEIDKQAMNIQAALIRMKSEKEDQVKEDINRAVMLDDTIKNSGRLESMWD